MKNTLLMAVAGLALMACSPSEPAAPSTTGAADPAATAPAATPEPSAPPDATAATPQTPGADTCNMAQYAALVGKPVTDSGVPAASPTVRIIKPDTQVTMDFAAARLNIQVNSAGVITGLKCG